MSYDDLGAVGDQLFTVGDDGTNFAEMNKGVTPIFFVQPVLNPKRSAEEGRPQYDEMEFVRILVAADQFNQIVNPVDDVMKQRFAPQYARWQANKSERHIDGTPLRMWPPLTIVQIAELEGMNIFSVEGLAAVADSNMHRSQSLRGLRDKAIVWLETAKGSAETLRQAEENDRLREEMAELRKTIAELSDRVGRGVGDVDEPAEGRRGPGRPRKEAA